jgi:hypothetical protein
LPERLWAACRYCSATQAGRVPDLLGAYSVLITV